VLAARVTPCGDAAWLAGEPTVAFAGIANPARFFALVESLGARLLERVAFPDHHLFSAADCARLLSRAQAKGARLVTTEKDWVRLDGEGVHRALRERTRPLPIELTLEERDLGRLASLIEAATKEQGYPRRPARPPQL
jgi:tetraacyldisaccharide 4'-kinase